MKVIDWQPIVKCFYKTSIINLPQPFNLHLRLFVYARLCVIVFPGFSYHPGFYYLVILICILSACSAGGDGKFEEVLNLSNDQHQANQENTPTPLIAFEGSSNHTEGGRLSTTTATTAATSSLLAPQLDHYANYLHEQVAGLLHTLYTF